MAGYPPFGTHPIKCAKRKCTFVGYETDLHKKPSRIGGVDCQKSICPLCGSESYQFLTEKQKLRFEMVVRDG